MTATVSAHMLRCLHRARRSYCHARCCGRSCSLIPAHKLASEMADWAGGVPPKRENTYARAFREIARKPAAGGRKPAAASMQQEACSKRCVNVHRSEGDGKSRIFWRTETGIDGAERDAARRSGSRSSFRSHHPAAL